MKLLTKDLKAYREAKLREQQGKCALCSMVIPDGKACLDHQHSEDKSCRGVLCSPCNVVLGKIENNYRRAGMDRDKLIKFSEGLTGYLTSDYSNGPRHPKEKTPLEIEIKSIKRTITKSKKDITKDKHKLRLKELQSKLKKENENIWKLQ